MKLYINRKKVVGPWGGGAHAINSLYDHLPHHGFEIVESLRDQPDCIIMMDPRPDGTNADVNDIFRHKMRFQSVKLIHRVNECDARKGTNDVDVLLQNCSKLSDHTVFVSNWMMEYHLQKSWNCKSNSVIVNGVNKNIFNPGKKLNNGKTNIVCAHWSDNRMKGEDEMVWLDNWIGSHNDYAFTFVGRTKAKFKNSIHVQPLHGLALANEIKKHDICINASKHDPGPNSVIEPISCGLPTYVHTMGGGGVEFAGVDHAFSSTDELEQILLKKNFIQNSMSFNRWDDVVCEYAKLIVS